MRFLLDSNVLVRMVRGDVSAKLKTVLNDPESQLYVSVASLWQLALKCGAGKLRLPEDFRERLEREGCVWLAITPEHAWAVSRLPQLHGDPFDRVIVVQAMAEGLVLVTSDRLLQDYGLEVFSA